ncbi:MAG: hypothetical protein UV80_C0016G0003 [Candidatus Peregrinibacteria bacterium GW2011_GWF2_43_17]|nr:MAG: hypothetical protein UV80_C0016G0003 [Candidatus Peregrinibacteria bacterium GW2011_GWF2_43_17]KKT18199.1 MAG: hypothetical protein UW03_C0044G0003 [Candidatus Peregrinibacteria bacterium GW2011_GWA2_43_8]
MQTPRKIFRAESLIETIVAVTVIALGATGAAVLTRTALLGNELSQDRMLALNLAREGTSAIGIIKDTNFIRYGGELDSCWNSLEGTSSDDCELTLIEDETYYILRADMETLGYYLEEASTDDVFDNEYQIYLCDFGGATLYANPGNDTVPYCTEETTFYRSIYITYPDATSMKIVSEVGWTTAGKQKTISETAIISKF